MTGNNLFEPSPKEQKDTIKKGRFKVKRVASGAQEDGFLKMRRNLGKHVRLRQSPILKVTVYDISSMLPVSKALAEHYRVDSDPIAMCEQNSAIAVRLGRAEVGQMWDICGQVLEAAAHQDGWSLSPLGRPLISSLLDHQAQCSDFQTVAMLVCALTSPTTPRRKEVDQKTGKEKFWFLKSGVMSPGAGDSPYHTVHTLSTMSDPKLDSLFSRRNTRSNSWTEAGQEEQEERPARSEQAEHGEARHGLLEPGNCDLYSAAITAYSELLYNWGFLRQRTEVAQHGPSQVTAEWSRVVTNKVPLSCLVCRLPVYGLSITCPVCGHGGHLAHVQAWYQAHDKCPAKCECQCKKYL